MSSQELLQIYSAYLPYGVSFKCTDIDSGEYEISTLKYIDISFEEIGVGSIEYDYTDLGQGELLMCLRPLSDLTKEIEHEGKKFIPWHELEFGIDKDLDIEIIVGDSEYLYISYTELRNEMQKLFEWHFDVFSLIEKGLAINLNEVK